MSVLFRECIIGIPGEVSAYCLESGLELWKAIKCDVDVSCLLILNWDD